MTRKQLLWARILLGVYLLALLVLCFANFSSIPEVKKQLFGIPMDKVVHFCMFFPFPILAFIAFDKYSDRFPMSVFWIVVVFGAGVLLAVATELGQNFLTTYRSGDRNDFLADLISLALSSLVVLFYNLWRQRRVCPEK